MNTHPQPIKLHRFRLSGHSHRVQLLLSYLGLPVELIDVPSGGQRSPEFLVWNRFGQVPVIEDNGFVLGDSNAILVYLAMIHDPKREWYPTDPKVVAEIQRWLSVAAGPLFSGMGLARLVGLFDAKHDLARAQATAASLLKVMEGHLATSGGYFVGGRPTIADVALYSYTAHAPEGHIPLGPYPAVVAWLRRIETLPGFVPMQRTEPRFGSPSGI